jgi:hypothetical protein
MVIEAPYTPLKRYDPGGLDFLVGSTADLSDYATTRGINQVQDLSGMRFQPAAPAGGQPGSQVFVHYSASTYNRWDYDPASGTYLRFSDTTDVTDLGQSEQYAQLTDRLTDQPIAFSNVVVLYVNHDLFSRDIYDIQLTGSGEAVAFRDGQAYQVQWVRGDKDVVSLTTLDGAPFPFKPGITCFEIIGLSSTSAQDGSAWRFIHQAP